MARCVITGGTLASERGVQRVRGRQLLRGAADARAVPGSVWSAAPILAGVGTACAPLLRVVETKEM